VLALHDEVAAFECREQVGVVDALAVGQRCERGGLGVAIGVGLGIGTDASRVDGAVALAGEVGQRDVDFGAFEAGRADELAQPDGVVVGSGVDRCAVEPEFREAAVEVLAGLVGEVGGGLGAFLDREQAVVAEVEGRAGDRGRFQRCLVGHPVDGGRLGRGRGFQHRAV